MADESAPKKFYIALDRSKSGQFTRCSISINQPQGEVENEGGASTEVAKESPKIKTTVEPNDFSEVVAAFKSTMEGYRNFIPITFWIGNHLAHELGFRSINELAEARGHLLKDSSSDGRSVFELDIQHYRRCMIMRERMNTAVEGAKQLPEIVLIGLVSAYDAMLGRLLKVVFTKHEEIVLTSEKTLKFCDLLSYQSIDAAKEALIDKEIETILRESHHEQFNILQNKFKPLKLREGLSIWPTFIEVCERRNLITHTGGVVTAQYLASGKENKFDTTGLSVGQLLKVSPKYYADAVNAVYEIGTKLCHVFWRKFSEAEREQADKALNEFGYSLIVERNYELAEAILRFAVTLPKHHADAVRRMMVVNLANAVRLQNRKDEALEILAKEDWSAVGNDFKISVAAVKGDIDEVVKLMELIGAGGVVEAHDYQDWPVFRDLRTNEKFATGFEKVFGSKLLTNKKTEVQKIEKPPPEESSDSMDEFTKPKLIH